MRVGVSDIVIGNPSRTAKHENHRKRRSRPRRQIHRTPCGAGDRRAGPRPRSRNRLAIRRILCPGQGPSSTARLWRGKSFRTDRRLRDRALPARQSPDDVKFMAKSPRCRPCGPTSNRTALRSPPPPYRGRSVFSIALPPAISSPSFTCHHNVVSLREHLPWRCVNSAG